LSELAVIAITVRHGILSLERFGAKGKEAIQLALVHEGHQSSADGALDHQPSADGTFDHQSSADGTFDQPSADDLKVRTAATWSTITRELCHWVLAVIKWRKGLCDEISEELI
jgi:hypothetical protein